MKTVCFCHGLLPAGRSHSSHAFKSPVRRRLVRRTTVLDPPGGTKGAFSGARQSSRAKATGSETWTHSTVAAYAPFGEAPWHKQLALVRRHVLE